MKLKKLVAAVALTLGVPVAAHATLISPNGSAPAIDVGSLDWTQTSFLAVGGQQAIANFSSGACVANPSACQFTVLTMANLGNFVAPDGVTNIQNTGLGTSFQWTMVASFTETVTSIDAGATAGTGTAHFATVTSIPGNLEIFYDTTLNANAVSGSGYNDGKLILQGSEVQDASGNFEVTNATAVNLDQSASNLYNGQKTVTGTGSNTSIGVGNLTVDSAFFVQALADFGINFDNVSIGLPFKTTHPSDCFQQGSTGTAVGGTASSASAQCQPGHVNGLMSANNDSSLHGGYLPDIGATNGLFLNGAPDFIAQTDFNSPLTPKAVPEPASLALLGLGLGIAGWSVRRKRS